MKMRNGTSLIPQKELIIKRIFVGVALMGILISFAPASKADVTLSFSPSPVASPAVGEQLRLDLNITGGENIAGYQVTVQFDATALRYVESANADYLPAGAFAVPAAATENTVTLAATSLSGERSGDGTLATLTFEVISAKASTLTIAEALLSDSAASGIHPAVEIGQITEPPALKEDMNKEVDTSSAILSFSPSPVASPAVGEQLRLDLNITGGENIAGYQVTVQFDATALRYVESANADYLPAGAFAVPAAATENTVTLAATSLSGERSGDGTLATLTFEVISAKASTLTIAEALLSDSAANAIPLTVEIGQITEPPVLKEDLNKDGVVDIKDLILVAANFGETGENVADVNDDGTVNIHDLILVAGAFGETAAAPFALYRDSEGVATRWQVAQWLREARQVNLGDIAFQRGILVLEQLLAALMPRETALLANYPNPFNPETWIPYQLASPADVTLRIHAVDGSLVRTLSLGHKGVGIYQSRNRAAYWDGKNELGESVASGVYFYTLTAGDFTATRKMLIRK